MTEQEFMILACTLRTCYPNQTFLPNKQALSLWYELLKDISYRAASYAVRKWTVENKFVPTVAEIRKTAQRYEEDLKLPQDIRAYMGYERGNEMQLSKAADILAVEEIKDKPNEFYQALGIALNSLTAWEELKDGITAEKNRCLDMSGVK